MSYGFGTTFGSNNETDRIVWLASDTPTIETSWLFWFNMHDIGGGGFGRLLELGGSHLMLYDGTGLQFVANWDGGNGIWTVTLPSLDAWHHLAIVYDAGSPSNAPVIYLDGSSVTVTPVGTPVGTYNLAATDWCIGNRAATLNRAWDGRLAEFARIAHLLTDGEVASQAGGQSAEFLGLAGDDRYVKLLDATGLVSVTGALVDASHPTITYPTVTTRRGGGLLLGVG